MELSKNVKEAGQVSGVLGVMGIWLTMELSRKAKEVGLLLAMTFDIASTAAPSLSSETSSSAKSAQSGLFGLVDGAGNGLFEDSPLTSAQSSEQSLCGCWASDGF